MIRLSRESSSAIDSIKLLCNLLVLPLHAWAAVQYVPQHTVGVYLWNFFSNYLCPFLLPVLFFLSGYFFFATYDGSRQSYLRKIRSRFFSYIVPYLLWNGLFVCFYLAASAWVPRLDARVNSFNLRTVWGCVNSLVGLTRNPIDGPLWFLRNIFVYSLAAPLFLRLYRGRRIWLFLLPVGGLSFWLRYELWPLFALVSFFMGGYLAVKGLDICVYFTAYRRQAVIVCLAAAVASFSATYFISVLSSFRYPLMIVSYYAAIIAVFAGAGRIQAWLAGNFWQKTIMPAGFFIYASHFLFCSIVLHIAAPQVNVRFMKLTLLYGVFCFIGGLLCLAVFRLGIRYCPTITALFDGRPLARATGRK